MTALFIWKLLIELVCGLVQIQELAPSICSKSMANFYTIFHSSRERFVGFLHQSYFKKCSMVSSNHIIEIKNLEPVFQLPLFHIDSE